MATSIKLDDKLKSRIQHLGKLRQCSSHWIMRAAIRDYVTREEQHEAFKQEALRAWESYQENGLHLTLEEADICWPKLAAGVDMALPRCYA
ncbi:MAG: ribbon-helix-helix protein, CopG family [Gammaproteobacteria bacterium]|nr:ribbon-helix-helix protein, CopG family [Gammaproteobacteria bacterium]